MEQETDMMGDQENKNYMQNIVKNSVLDSHKK